MDNVQPGLFADPRVVPFKVVFLFLFTVFGVSVGRNFVEIPHLDAEQVVLCVALCLCALK